VKARKCAAVARTPPAAYLFLARNILSAFWTLRGCCLQRWSGCSGDKSTTTSQNLDDKWNCARHCQINALSAGVSNVWPCAQALAFDFLRSQLILSRTRTAYCYERGAVKICGQLTQPFGTSPLQEWPDSHPFHAWQTPRTGFRSNSQDSKPQTQRMEYPPTGATNIGLGEPQTARRSHAESEVSSTWHLRTQGSGVFPPVERHWRAHIITTKDRSE
jgi:hypothetical protein